LGPHFITVNYDTDGFIFFNGSIGLGPPTVTERFCASGQFEIHTPSDHTYKGAHYDVEIEILHVAMDGSEARISIFFDSVLGGSTSSPLFEALNISPKT